MIIIIKKTGLIIASQHPLWIIFTKLEKKYLSLYKSIFAKEIFLQFSNRKLNIQF